MRWLAVFLVMATPVWLEARDYTCYDVRQGSGGGQKELTNPYIPFDSTRIQSRTSALEFVKEVQRRAHLQALEMGSERSVPVDWALSKVAKYLTCEDSLKIIMEDIRFYDKHQDLLPQKTFPWSLKGMECAKDFIRSELKKKNLSRMYRGWLIVQASYFWYEEFRDSLLAVAKDKRYPWGVREDAVVSIRDTSKEAIQTLLELVNDKTKIKVPVSPWSKRKKDRYPIREVAIIKLYKLKKQHLLPEKVRREWEKQYEGPQVQY